MSNRPQGIAPEAGAPASLSTAEQDAVEDMAETLRGEISAGTLELPLLPNVAAEVLSSSLDARSDAARLSELIQQDQSLASHILKIVNSPAYRGAAEIVALQQAIARLGLERIREIALTASLKGSLFKPGPYDELVQAAWLQSLATALWSKELARSQRKNVETTYLCGLLNNVGTPVILHRVSAEPSIQTPEQAQCLVQQLQSPVGVALTEAWQLPGLVTSCIAHGKNFLLAPSEHDAVALVVAGREFARSMLAKQFEPPRLLNLDAVQFLNLYPEDLEEILLLEPQLQESLDAMSL